MRYAITSKACTDVISKNQFNKSLIARVVKNKEILVFPCEEHRDSRQVFKENPTINISETKVKHYANNVMILSYHQISKKEGE